MPKSFKSEIIQFKTLAQSKLDDYLWRYVAMWYRRNSLASTVKALSVLILDIYFILFIFYLFYFWSTNDRHEES